jgi:hypothetical protein
MGEILFEGKDISKEMTPIPGKFSSYLVHCPKGLLYSKKSNKFLLLNAKGTGDDSKYLQTSLRDDDGVTHNFYLSEIVMSSYMGISKQEWRAMGLEVDHIDSENTKNNCISNLRLVSSKGNKANRSYDVDRNYLTMDNAKIVREEFSKWEGTKLDFYEAMSKRFHVTMRTIQNCVLGVTYKVVADEE